MSVYRFSCLYPSCHHQSSGIGDVYYYIWLYVGSGDQVCATNTLSSEHSFFANLKLTHFGSFLEWAQQGLFASKESITDSSSGVAGDSKLFQSFSWVIEWLVLVEDLCWSTELLEVNECNCYAMSKESTPTSPSSCFYTLHRASFMMFSWGWLM